MYRKTTEKSIYNFVNNNRDKIEDIKIMNVSKPYGFNSMEGYHSDIRLKIETVKGYRNMFVEFTINSTYLELSEDTETFDNYANLFVENLLN